MRKESQVIWLGDPFRLLVLLLGFLMQEAEGTPEPQMSQQISTNEGKFLLIFCLLGFFSLIYSKEKMTFFS